MSKIIDLEMHRRRGEPDARDQLAEFMTTLDMNDSELTSVTLHALRDALEIYGLSRHEAKQRIAQSLKECDAP